MNYTQKGFLFLGIILFAVVGISLEIAHAVQTKNWPENADILFILLFIVAVFGGLIYCYKDRPDK